MAAGKKGVAWGSWRTFSAPAWPSTFSGRSFRSSFCCRSGEPDGRVEFLREPSASDRLFPRPPQEYSYSDTHTQAKPENKGKTNWRVLIRREGEGGREILAWLAFGEVGGNRFFFFKKNAFQYDLASVCVWAQAWGMGERNKISDTPETGVNAHFQGTSPNLCFLSSSKNRRSLVEQFLRLSRKQFPVTGGCDLFKVGNERKQI